MTFGPDKGYRVACGAGVVNPNSTGAETPLKKYDVYGLLRNPTQIADNGNPLGYCGSLGHPTDKNTGLIYMRARYYDPVTGRFISEDPGQNGGNWFIYANDNPLVYADADGHLFGLVDLLVEVTMQFLERSYAEHPVLTVAGVILCNAATYYSARLAIEEGGHLAHNAVDSFNDFAEKWIKASSDPRAPTPGQSIGRAFELMLLHDIQNAVYEDMALDPE